MQNTLPETGFVRLPEILKVIPVGRSTWWAGVASGRYPQAVKLSPHCTAWPVESIHELIKELAGYSSKGNATAQHKGVGHAK